MTRKRALQGHAFLFFFISPATCHLERIAVYALREWRTATCTFRQNNFKKPFLFAKFVLIAQTLHQDHTFTRPQGMFQWQPVRIM
uniref:Secreted protein n=1 Tax=Rhipicephalus zambeziensis TaxID=60191 RepID=A0A224Y7J7_9ACAR